MIDIDIPPKHLSIKELTPFRTGFYTNYLNKADSKKIIMLASNENPLGASKLAIKAIKSVIKNAHRYPNDGGFRLKKVISNQFNVELENIAIGNGSDELFSLLTQTFLRPEHEVIISQYGFSAFSIAVKIAGAKSIITPAINWGHNLTAMLEAITSQTKMIFIANPNNPTGTWINEFDLISFLKKIPSSIIVILDEAYAEYVTEPFYPNGTLLLKDFPNLIILKTFSKIYGLAGLRLGFSVSHPYFVEILNRVRLPYNVNVVALAAGEAAMLDQAYIKKSTDYNQREKNRLIKFFKRKGVDFIPSVTNFLTVNLGINAKMIFDQLKEKYIFVMPLDNYQMPHHLRITIGSQKENSYLIEKLETLI